VRLRLIPCAIFSASLLFLSTPAQATATFDTDLEGWNATGISIGYSFPNVSLGLTDNSGDMVWDGSDGNPAGFAKLPDAIPSPSSWAEAPSSFYNNGDLSAFLGGALSFEHKLIDTGTNIAGSQPPFGPYLAVLMSGDPMDWNSLIWTSPGPTGTTDWVPFSIGLDSGSLTLLDDVTACMFDPSLPCTALGDIPFSNVNTTMTLEQILADLDHVLLPFELVNNQGTQNSEMGGIDNVQLIAAAPEPATWSLLLLGSLLLRRRLR